MTVTADHGLAVLHCRTAGGPLRYDQPSHAAAYAAWGLLGGHGRDEVTARI
jgi:hypothetical protein